MGRSDYFGIAIRMTDPRGSFFTASDTIKDLIATVNKKGKAYYASELSVTAHKINDIKFVIFFDIKRKTCYFGEIEKIEHQKKNYHPEDCMDYGSDNTDHKTWILLKSLCEISEALLQYIYVFEGEPEGNNTLAEKIKEPRFPRVYVYISRDSGKYNVNNAIDAFLQELGKSFVKTSFDLSDEELEKFTGTSDR